MDISPGNIIILSETFSLKKKKYNEVYDPQKESDPTALILISNVIMPSAETNI